MTRELNYTRIAFFETDEDIKEELFPTWKDKVFNVTGIVSGEIANAWYNCASTGYDAYVWGSDFQQKFEGNDTYSYPVSVMQETLA